MKKVVKRSVAKSVKKSAKQSEFDDFYNAPTRQHVEMMKAIDEMGEKMRRSKKYARKIFIAIGLLDKNGKPMYDKNGESMSRKS